MTTKIVSYTISGHLETDDGEGLERLIEDLSQYGACVRVTGSGAGTLRAVRFSLSGERPDSEDFDGVVQTLENASQGELSVLDRRQRG
jgi:hypothetical protein